MRFQSTLPVGGATLYAVSPITFPSNFNPRSPWGERRMVTIQDAAAFLFQSTLPVGGATQNEKDLEWHQRISIHAPRGGSDMSEW